MDACLELLWLGVVLYWLERIIYGVILFYLIVEVIFIMRLCFRLSVLIHLRHLHLLLCLRIYRQGLLPFPLPLHWRLLQCRDYLVILCHRRDHALAHIAHQVWRWTESAALTQVTSTFLIKTRLIMLIAIREASLILDLDGILHSTKVRFFFGSLLFELLLTIVLF